MISIVISHIRNFILNKGFFISRTVEKTKLDEFFSIIKSNQKACDLIRIGGDGDGGYLLPNDLDGIIECFSPGVDVIANFEKQLISRGLRCYLADYSVDSAPFKHELLSFNKKYLGLEDNEVYLRLDTWVKSNSTSNCDLLLQMDIEGAEYAVIADTPDEILNKFRIIVIEFHHLNRLFEFMSHDLISLTFRKILANFDIVHIHPNNCRKAIALYDYLIPPVMEFTFVRKDRLKSVDKSGVRPSKLDFPNVVGVEDVLLPECWSL